MIFNNSWYVGLKWLRDVSVETDLSLVLSRFRNSIARCKVKATKIASSIPAKDMGAIIY